MEAEAYIGAILADPKDLEPWLRYADWLLDRGDPRGELIQLALVNEREPSPELARRMNALGGDALLSPRLYEQSHLWSFGWWRGFITSASVIGAMDDPPTLETVDALFADPHAGLLWRISLAHPIVATVPLWHSLIAVPRPSVHTLEISDVQENLPLEHLPRLHTLVIEHSPRIDSLAHPELHTLKTNRLGCQAAITGEVDLPSLEALHWSWTVTSGRRNTPPPVLEPDPLFTTPTSILFHPPPRLVELTLGPALTYDFGALAGSALTRQLRHLVVWGITVRTVLEHAAAFRGLEALALEFPRDDLVRAEAESLERELRAALPNTTLEIRWGGFADERSPRKPPLDADSRNEEGRVDAIGAWIRGRR